MVLPIQTAYYSGLRIGEVCGLAWQDINLEEQYLTVKRSIRYDGSKHRTIIGPTKRKKIRTVDFGDTLAAILRKARKEQLGELAGNPAGRATSCQTVQHLKMCSNSARILDKVAGMD